MTISTNSRYAHSEGLTSIFWDSFSGKFFTCGSDGDVRIWQDFKNDDPVSYRIGEQATAIVVHNEKMFVADEAGYIQTFLLPDGVKDGFVTKFNEHVVHMAINSSGDHILACSRDFSIKWASTKDNSQITFGLIDGHTAPVTSVSLDPKEEFFASSSVDGSVKVWSLEDSSKPLKNLHILEKSNDISPNRQLCRLKWHPKTAEILAVPVGRCVQLYARNTWNLIKTLENDEISDLISVVSFSTCGKYLAAGCLNGRLVVWDFVRKTSVLSEILPQKRTICDLLWHPTDADCIIFCDIKGYVGVVKGILGKPSEVLKPEPKFVLDDVEDGMSRDSDIGAIKSRYTSQIFGVDDDDEVVTIEDDSKPTIRQSVLPAAPLPPSWKPQSVPEPFIVGSTPKHLSERFMKWNSVGIVRQYNTENECSIDVEFHDASTHHALQIENAVTKYSMADLSVEALALASSVEEAAKSRLYVLHFGSWDSSRDWSIDLPEGEDICCLCLGFGWIAFGTRQRNVRIFSVAGVQLKCFALQGPLITMAGHLDQLLVVFVSGLDFNGNSKVSCFSCRNPHTFDGNKSSAIYVDLSLTCESKLIWLGFTFEGSPCFADSHGFVRIYDSSTWVQIFDSKFETKNDLDSIWITSVHEYSSQIRGVRCKRTQFPSILPRPTATAFQWRLNFIERDTEKTNNEEKFSSCNMRKRHCWSTDDAELAKSEFESILKLFLLACNAERDCRALEVARLADSTTTLNALINLASKKGRRVLAEKISDLARQRTADERQESYSRAMSSSGTQPLFADDEDVDVQETALLHTNGDVTPRIENPLRKIENRSQSASILPLNGPVRNPFKKVFETNVDSSEKTVGQSVFDTMSMPKKRSSTTSKSTDLFSDDAKKRKTLTIKKQSKLSFGRQASESLPDDKQKFVGLELFTKENVQNLSQSFDGEPSLNSFKFKEHAKLEFIKLAESERENWNLRALSLLEKLETIKFDESFISTDSQTSAVLEEKKRISIDSFAFSP